MSKVFNVSFLHAKGKNQIRDGLMYRKKKLKKNQGMLFHTGLKVSSFWMKNTFIPLDVLFLNKSGKILGYKENNKPHSLKGITIGKKSFYVLEMNGGWVRENKVKVGDKIKIRKTRTRKKRGGVRRGRQYHPLETLASNDMLDFFRNPGKTNEIVPTAMERCRSDHTKKCLSQLLNAQELPHSKSDFTDEQLEIYNGIIETCKPKDIVVPWNTQSGEGQGGGRRKKTRKKRAGVKIDIGSFWTRINPHYTNKSVWQVIGIISDKGKGIIQIAKPEYGNTMLRSYGKENFFRLYKPFNDKPGGDTVPQIARKESGGDKIGGGKRKKEESSGSSGSKPAKKKTSTPQVDEATKCAICLKGTRCTRCDNAVIHCPACKGIFHRYCLSAWINTVLPEVAKCPLCNALLPEKTYTTLGLTHPNQANNNNNNNVNITALDVNELYSIATPNLVTGSQGETEIQNVLMIMLGGINAQGRARTFERMSAVRFAITRAEQVAENLVGNYNATTNRTPFLQALIADWAAFGGHGYYRYLNAVTGIASIDMEQQQVQENEDQLYTQNRQGIGNATTVQGIYNIINNTITQYEAGPGESSNVVTPFYQALNDDRMYLEVLL